MNVRNFLYAATVLMAFAAMTPLGGANQAWAGNDMKTYPGVMCQPKYLSNRKDIQYRTDGGVTNTSRTRDLIVHCSIIRDETGTRNGLRVVGVYYDDHHPTKTLHCTVSSMTTKEPTSGRLIQRRSGSSPIGLKSKGSFGIRGLTKSYKSGNSYYSMFCRIPPASSNGRKSVLYTYYVEEHD